MPFQKMSDKDLPPPYSPRDSATNPREPPASRLWPWWPFGSASSTPNVANNDDAASSVSPQGNRNCTNTTGDNSKPRH